MLTSIFYTVPLIGSTMTRATNGAKLIDGKLLVMPSWAKYQDTRNTKETPLLAAIARKDFIGIDIDDNALYKDILTLNPNPAYHARSDLKGGHLLFAYDSNTYTQLKSVSKYLKAIKIDIQIDNKLIFLATPANKTKTLLTPPLNSLEDLTPMPNTLLIYLQGLVASSILESKSTQSSIPSTIQYIGDYHAPILKKPKPEIVYRLTPKRDYPNITNMNQIPEGMGTDWMLQVRKKLQTDPSVDPELFLSTMHYLNSLWNVPMTESRIDSDVQRDIDSSDFTYDREYNKKSLLLWATNSDTIEILFDPYLQKYILFNRTSTKVTIYATASALIDAITVLTRVRLTKDSLLKKVNPVESIETPLEPSYYHGEKFNAFVPSEGLALLRDPDILQEPKTPHLILWFLKHLIPDTNTRILFEGFLAHKYSTYDYTPFYIVLAGVGGAGKGLLVHEILAYLSGINRIYNIDADKMGEKFNHFISSIDWLELEEPTDGMSFKETQRLVGILKRLTGNPHIAVERKGIDSTIERHFATPIISTNLSSKLITDTPKNDRRLVYIKCPTPLIDAMPYTDPETNITIDNTRDFIDKLREELPHFAVWLAKIPHPISHKDYSSNEAWKGDDYYAYLDATLSQSDKLLSALESQSLDKTLEVLKDAGVHTNDIDALFAHSGRITDILLYNTANTDMLDMLSLEDIFSKYSAFSGNVRKIYNHLKNRTTKTVHGVTVSCYTLKLNGSYKSQNRETLSDL